MVPPVWKTSDSLPVIYLISVRKASYFAEENVLEIQYCGLFKGHFKLIIGSCLKEIRPASAYAPLRKKLLRKNLYIQVTNWQLICKSNLTHRYV